MQKYVVDNKIDKLVKLLGLQEEQQEQEEKEEEMRAEYMKSEDVENLVIVPFERTGNLKRNVADGQLQGAVAVTQLSEQ